MASNSAKRSYRRRTSRSKCRGLKVKTCNKRPRCKMTKRGKKPRFCRKSKNRHRKH